MPDLLPRTLDAVGLGAANLPQLAELVEEFKRADEDDLALLDVAAINLMCAGGLPGAESLEFGRYFEWLDYAAREAGLLARRHWYRFIASPRTYNESPGYFCCYFLLQVLQEDFGVRYNPLRVRDRNFQNPMCLDPDFRDSRDLFIHGIIDGPGGTCASMPVIYAAVGRRLGYPLKLVETRGHFFVRWEDPLGRCFHVPERFNVEGAGEGISSYADDFYRTWPERWTEADIDGDWYLKSLTPKQELAAFLATRASCLEDNGRFAEAVQAYCWARDLAPHDARYAQIAFHRAGRLERQRETNVAMLLDANRRAANAATRVGWMLDQAAWQDPGAPLHGDIRGKRFDSANAIPTLTVCGLEHSGSCQCFHCKQRRSSPQQRNKSSTVGAEGRGAFLSCRSADTALPGRPEFPDFLTQEET